MNPEEREKKLATYARLLDELDKEYPKAYAKACIAIGIILEVKKADLQPASLPEFTKLKLIIGGKR